VFERRFDRSSRLWRKSTGLTCSVLLVFVAAGVALGLHRRALGFVLLAAGVLTGVAGFCVAVAAYNRFKVENAAFIRDALADQRRPTGMPPRDGRH